jgi:diadenosine tetraphosphate (Ap4A) HIT family hydrolase
MILSSKRHIYSIDEFIENEQANFIKLIVRLRKGMREVLNINQVNIITAELPNRKDGHFHIWLFPVSKETTEKFGTGIKAVKPAMLYAKENLKTPDNIRKVEEYAEKLRNYMVSKQKV